MSEREGRTRDEGLDGVAGLLVALVVLVLNLISNELLEDVFERDDAEEMSEREGVSARRVPSKQAIIARTHPTDSPS